MSTSASVIEIPGTGTSALEAARLTLARDIRLALRKRGQLVPRLADKVPAFEDGTISMLPDGRMKVVYPLRHDVLWQDGVPFTADDLVFSAAVRRDPTGASGGESGTAYRFVDRVE